MNFRYNNFKAMFSCNLGKWSLLILLKLVLLILVVGCKSDKPPEPILYNVPTSTGEGAIEPEKALSTFELPPGFKIELIASEPLISDPVDMIIDEYGRMYVAEMHGYPLDTSGTGTIKLLKDIDGDGRMDEATIFADGLTMPFGLMRWKEGLLVADAPEILYLADTNGDGKADVREVMLTGFAFSNAQMNAGNPIYGIDNWIYLTSEAPGTYQIYKEIFGYMGDDIFFPANSDSPRLPQQPGRTVRFKPDGYKLELTAGSTQFGRDFDEWGRHILSNNSNHIYHEVISAPYIERNPDLLISYVTQTLTDHGSNVFPITANPERQLLTSEGVFTSASGITAYTGDTFPSPFDNSFFVAEPVSNVVHVDRLEDKGASFTAKRIHSEKEFLASTDAWFRPVNMYSGPEGALYVLDYYRQIIEHPEWMSKEAIEAGELYNGVNMGRIYRIIPTESTLTSALESVRLGDANNKELVKELANPNGWWRLNAQRLLVDRADKGIIPDLEDMALNSNSATGRLHALWTIEGLGGLNTSLIKKALRDTVGGLRENAIKLAESHLSANPDLVKDLLEMRDDTNDKVRFQLLLTLGSVNTPEAAQVRNDLLFQNLNDNWFQIAALTASSSQDELLLNMVLNNFDEANPAYSSLVERLSAMVGRRGETERIRQLIRQATGKKQWPPAVPVLKGIAQGLDESSSVPEQEQNLLIESFFENPSDKMRRASLSVLQVTGIQNEMTHKAAIERALKNIENSNLNDDKRAEAINFIAQFNPTPHAEVFKDLIVPQEEAFVQLAALNALSRIPDLTVSHFALQNWPNFTPEMRNAAINTFLSDKERASLLLEALEQGKIDRRIISFPVSVRLMTGYGEDFSRRARALFANKKDGDVNEKYQEALTIKGYVNTGKTIYLENCATCHTKGDLGTRFGPDLGTIQAWKAEAIMAHILDPNISIAAGYDLWTATLKDGSSIGGIISSETPSAITIINAGGVERTIARDDIESLKALDMSAMPGGWEEQITVKEMADLLAYLRQNE